ncbi:MAG: sigma 54-interacting transcriptional regulator, partial [Desulfobacterota bacterium]|nr:sigma 54-interacting transcriptional regulator [Thermodesulfobacteriota bacterium]
LQDGEYLPLGSDLAKRSDARIIVATNQDLAALQADGVFRRDLYYRICDQHLHLPPLRERLEDLPLLLHHFLEKAAAALGRRRPTAPNELAALLAAYHFPGNLRELESMVFDAVSNHRSGKLSMELFKAHIFQKPPASGMDQPEPAQTETASLTFPERLPTLKELERLLVDEALRRAGSNQSIAALSLGITRQALNKRLRKDRCRKR